MKTSQLIDTLAADGAHRTIGLSTRFLLALALGSLLSAVVFFASIGPRADFAVAAHTVRFDLKFLDSLALALPSALLAWRLLRPDRRADGLVVIFLAPFLLLGAGVIVELTVVPRELWCAKLVGSNAIHCLTIIPLLSMGPLTALLLAMRRGAPDNSTLAGALAGAASAGVAALLYASNCPDDSPLFVATWYPLATLVAVAVGAIAGNRFLRW